MREERERKAKKKEEDEIQRKKDRARLKGLQNTERKRQQKQREKQISRIDGDKRREARLKKGHGGSGTKPAAWHCADAQWRHLHGMASIAHCVTGAAR